jgi:rod shape-determining protein MreB
MFNDIFFKILPLIAIDLGTSNIRIKERGEGNVLQEPSVIAFNTINDSVVALGREARKMMGRTPEHVIATHPMKNGVISDFKLTELLLSHYINSVRKNESFVGNLFRKYNAVIGVPAIITEVEINAIVDAIRSAGVRNVYVVEDSILSALGAGIDISLPKSHLIVDIGGGTTDISVISMKSVVMNNSIKMGGDYFDEVIIDYIKRKYNLLIGKKVAEDIKIKYATLDLSEKLVQLEVSGRDMLGALPKKITMTNKELAEALTPSFKVIITAIKDIIEKSPPEVLADLMENGIMLTGGGSLISGISKMLAKDLKLKVEVTKNPILCILHVLDLLTQDLNLLKELIIKDLIIK